MTKIDKNRVVKHIGGALFLAVICLLMIEHYFNLEWLEISLYGSDISDLSAIVLLIIFACIYRS